MRNMRDWRPYALSRKHSHCSNDYASGHPTGMGTKIHLRVKFSHRLPVCYLWPMLKPQGLEASRTDNLIEKVDECPSI